VKVTFLKFLHSVTSSSLLSATQFPLSLSKRLGRLSTCINAVEEEEPVSVPVTETHPLDSHYIISFIPALKSFHLRFILRNIRS